MFAESELEVLQAQFSNKETLLREQSKIEERGEKCRIIEEKNDSLELKIIKRKIFIS